MPLGIEFVVHDLGSKVARLEDAERESIAAFAELRKDSEFAQEMLRNVAAQQRLDSEKMDQVAKAITALATELQVVKTDVQKIEKRDADRKEWLQTAGKSLAKKALMGGGALVVALLGKLGWASGGAAVASAVHWLGTLLQ